MGAFFVGAIYAASLAAAPVCPSDQPLAPKPVARVIDGDTLRLVDGTRIRLAGINAPELRGNAQTPEPYARNAQKALSQLVKQSAGRLYLHKGSAQQDRYGRTVTALYTAQGDNVQALLLGQGLAYFVAFFPESSNLSCLQTQEAHARQARLGIWRNNPVKTPQALSAAGFAIVRGRVSRVRPNANGAWLRLDNQLDVYLAPEILQVLGRGVTGFVDRELEVRGWVVKQVRPQSGAKSAAWLLRLSHPLMLK